MANCKEKGKQPNDSGAKKEHGRDQSERRCFNCHQQGHMARDCPSALYCGVMKTSSSQRSGGRAVEGQGGAEEGASDGVLGSMESGGDTGDSGGCVEERKQVGEVNGGDGGGGHGEQDKGRQEASWECVEDGKTIGYGSGGGGGWGAETNNQQEFDQPQRQGRGERGRRCGVGHGLCLHHGTAGPCAQGEVSCWGNRSFEVCP